MRHNEKQCKNMIMSIYNKTFREIVNEIVIFYDKYSNNGVLSWAESQRLLNTLEMLEYKGYINDLQGQYINTNDNYLLQEINALNAKNQITRYEMLMDIINIKLIHSAYSTQEIIRTYLMNVYDKTNATEIKKVGAKREQKDSNKKILVPLAGALFIDRIWRNKNKTKYLISDQITNSIYKRDNVSLIKKNVSSIKQSCTNQFNSLVTTETTNAIVNSKLDTYKDNEMYGVRIITAGDERVCSKCQNLNGKVVKLEDAIPGETIPPFHTNCRCDIEYVTDKDEI